MWGFGRQSFAGVDSTANGLRRAAVILIALTALLWLSRNAAVDAALRLRVGDVVVRYGRAPILEDIAARIEGPEGEQASARGRTWHAASPAEEPLAPRSSNRQPSS